MQYNLNSIENIVKYIDPSPLKIINFKWTYKYSVYEILNNKLIQYNTYVKYEGSQIHLHYGGIVSISP